MNNSERPASPVIEVNDSEVIDHLGLTKREVFAMAAMQGLLANEFTIANCNVDYKGNAVDAVLQADALLKQLEKQDE